MGHIPPRLVLGPSVDPLLSGNSFILNWNSYYLISMEVTYIVFIAIFLGVLCRTLFPYVKKMKEAEAKGDLLKFDYKYLYTAISSLVLSVIVTLLIFPTFKIPEATGIYLFCMSFTFGWSTNDIVNELLT